MTFRFFGHYLLATGRLRPSQLVEAVELQKEKNTDLSRLAIENEGEFASDEVHAAIDGREDVRTHGSREMPVWGIGLQDRSRDADQEDEVRERIHDLVAFIESIQKSD